MGVKRKLQIFDACVISKLTYGLHVACLNKAERRRLDGFHCRSLRSILKIPAAFYSRVSNEEVFRRAGTRPVSRILLEKQLNYLHRVANSSDDSILRKSVLAPGSFLLQRPAGVRRVGRPRANWGEATWSAALEAARSEQALKQFMNGSASAWRREVRRHLA